MNAVPVMPAAVHQALRKTMPGRYTPELADEVAAEIVARLWPLAEQTGGTQ
ncbi:hypothetical protein [Streptomyces sp. NPDC002685]|uniref:hypothetical protein n=1 Tax=Streptomyces sp. NPDC002685 TaxID=3154540 RepID=UPI003322656E